MAMFIRKADRIIHAAHNAIACAEMQLAHSFEPEDIAAAQDALAQAKRYLVRAIAARDAWDAVLEGQRSDYDEYPDVPEREQLSLL